MAEITIAQAIIVSSISIGSALAVGLCGLAAAKGEAAVGAAAVGAMAEKDEFFGKGMLMTVIPESIAIFGLVVALLLIFILPGMVGLV